MDEAWACCREFPEHYEISSLGGVRRLKASRGVQAGRVRKPVLHQKTGYLQCMLHVDGQYFMRSVHRLVAEAFIGPIGAGLVVNHKNGDKTDNRPENLEIVTKSENQTHSYRVLGVPPNTWKSGARNHNAKFGWDAVCAIRQEFNEGRTNGPELAKRYGVSRQTIYRIARGDTRVAS